VTACMAEDSSCIAPREVHSAQPSDDEPAANPAGDSADAVCELGARMAEPCWAMHAAGDTNAAMRYMDSVTHELKQCSASLAARPATPAHHGRHHSRGCSWSASGCRTI